MLPLQARVPKCRDVVPSLCMVEATTLPLKLHLCAIGVEPTLQKLASDNLDEAVAYNIGGGRSSRVSRAVDYDVDCVADGARLVERDRVCMIGRGSGRNSKLSGKGLCQMVGDNWVGRRLRSPRFVLSEVHSGR